MKEKIGRVVNLLKTDEGIMFLLVLFFPVGLVLLWRNKTYNKKVKIGITVVTIIYGIAFVSIDAERTQVKLTNGQQANQISEQATTIEETTEELTAVQDELTAYQEKMEPYESLSEADAKARKMDSDAAEKVNSLIEKLTKSEELTLENKEEIINTRKLFEALTKNQKELVNLAELTSLETEITKLEAEAKAAAEKAKAEAEAAAKKKEADAAAEKKRKEEEARGYETGITYDQLARTPDDYEYKKVKFYGKVIQVMEGDDVTQIRFAVDDNYDTVIYGEYDSSIVSTRVLEDDYITISGFSTGLLSYESTMGGNITIPSVSIEKID